jgi:hypothetical protein
MYARFLENKLRWTSTTWDNATLRVFQMGSLRRRVLFTPGLVKRRLKGPSNGPEPASPDD